MSQRGVDFLQHWIKERVNAVAYSPLNDTLAKVLAEQCAADAGQVGISVGEIEVETGDLAHCMLTAIEYKSGLSSTSRASESRASLQLRANTITGD
jgi:hypothetical protein